VSNTITREKVLAKFVEDLFLEKFLSSIIFEFEWDEGNKFKNLMKHNVPYLEIEEVFEDFDLLPLGLQVFPKVEEARYGLLGKTKHGKKLFISFTIRKESIRVISARRMHLKERNIYES
jgi:uncharacterized DUF497 family protein